MSKPIWTADDQLIMQVRELLKSTEPRPVPKKTTPSPFGFDRVRCPACGNKLRPGNYNHHWTYYHGTKFWKEKQLIALIKGVAKE